MKDFLNPERTFHFANDSKNKALQTLLDNAFNKLCVEPKKTEFPNHFWSAERYGLHLSKRFQSLDQELKNKILRRLTELNLSLSYFIEKSGHNYGAKMILLSDNQDEKSLYALFAADEAIHQREFMNHMWFIPEKKTHWHPMLDMLGEAIMEGERNTLIYVVQVLLEGFGMSFYSGLAESCEFHPMKNVYHRILLDEARHHGSGVTMAQHYPVNQMEKDQIFEYTKSFIISLQSANWITETLEQNSGELSIDEKNAFLENIKYEQTLAARRVKLKDMLLKVDNWGLVAMLEKDKVL